MAAASPPPGIGPGPLRGGAGCTPGPGRRRGGWGRRPASLPCPRVAAFPPLVRGRGQTKPQTQIRAQSNLFCSQAVLGAGWEVGEAAGSAPRLLSAPLKFTHLIRAALSEGGGGGGGDREAAFLPRLVPKGEDGVTSWEGPPAPHQGLSPPTPVTAPRAPPRPKGAPSHPALTWYPTPAAPTPSPPPQPRAPVTRRPPSHTLGKCLFAEHLLPAEGTHQPHSPTELTLELGRQPGARQVEFEAEGQGPARWEGCRLCVDGVVVGTAAQCPGPLAPSPALLSIGPGCPGPQWPNLEGESFQEEPLSSLSAPSGHSLLRAPDDESPHDPHPTPAVFCSSAQGVTAVDSAPGSLQGPTSDIWGSRAAALREPPSVDLALRSCCPGPDPESCPSPTVTSQIQRQLQGSQNRPKMTQLKLL
ncbi:uncharacterized protein [Muntiacus reevesi]|uniref:uncharacterized protein n=1 Tax=Muntiacus reevesi TaxID=9886 RepID=UPI003306CE0F